VEAWRKVCRDAFFPLAKLDTLHQLWLALGSDDERLQQGYTTYPAPIMAVQDWPVETVGCPLAMCGILEGMETVGETEEFFARLAFEIDNRLKTPGGVRFILNWWDNTPRAEAFSELFREIGDYLMDAEAKGLECSATSTA
jgi:hypothetical protein